MLKVSRKKLILVVLLLLALGAAPLLYLRYSPSARKARQLDRAARYFERGEFDNAKLEYMNVLRSDTESPVAIRNLGIIWYEQGVPRNALPLLVSSQIIAPGDPEVQRRLAGAFAATGYLTDARKAALTILEKEPNNPEALVILADTAATPADSAATEKHLESMADKTVLGYHLAQARMAYRKGDSAVAVAGLQKGITVDPASYLAHAALGEIYRLAQQPAKAEEEFKQATKLAPLRSGIRLKYADFKAKTGAPEEAEALAREVTDKAPDYLPAWLLRAETALARKKPDDAKQLLENVFVRDPQNGDARLLAAQIDLSRGETAKAIAAMEGLVRDFPNSVAIKFHLGRAYLVAGTPAKAAPVLNQALAGNPNYLEAILLLAEVNLAIDQPQRVVDAMEDVLKKAPKLSQAQVFLAEGYRRLGRLDDAAKIFQGQAAANEKNPSSHYLLGTVLRQQKKFPEARAAFEKAAEAAPDNALSVFQLVDLDLLEKKYPEALARIEKLRARTPKSGIADFLTGRVYAAQKKWDEAEATLLKALEADRNSMAPYQLLVTVYLQNKKTKEALAYLDARVQKKPDDLRSRMLMALIHEQLKEYPQAQVAYEKLLEVRPDFLPALNNLAYIYSEHLNQLDKAAENATKARAAQPNDPIERAKIADTLGWILFRKGDYSAAAPLLEEAAEKLPEYPEVQFHLAMQNYMSGQSDQALAIFKKLAATEAVFPGKEQVPVRLKLLGSEAGQPPQFSRAELQGLVTQFPNDPLLQLRLGETFEREGAADQALVAYEAALKLNPRYVPALVNVAQLTAAKDPAKALQLVKQVRVLASSDENLAIALGRVAFQAADFPLAYTLLQTSGPQARENPAVCRDLAWASYAVGKVSEAKENMERISKLPPNPAIAADAKKFLSMTVLVENPTALPAAAAEVEALIAANPQYVPALMARAALQVSQKENPAAVKTYQQVLIRYPEFIPAKIELAGLYLETPGEVDRAFDLATEASKSAPSDARVARVLGDVHFARKEYPEALRAWQRSANDLPLDAKRKYQSGLCYREAKDVKKAREVIQEALAGDLKEPLRSEAAKALKELPQ